MRTRVKSVRDKVEVELAVNKSLFVFVTRYHEVW